MKRLVSVLTVMACGGGGPGSVGSTDGGANDGGSDAETDGSNPDAPASYGCNPNTPAGLVTAHGHRGDLWLMSHDANGAWLNTVSFGGAYSAQIAVPGCGAITVGHPTDPGRFTVLGVQPGDEIFTPATFGGPTMQTSIVIDQPVAGTVYYTATGSDSCGGNVSAATSNSFLFYYDSRCTHADGSATVLVQARNNLPGTQVPVYSVFENVSLAQPLHVTSWQSPPTHRLRATLDPAAPALGVGWALASIDQGLLYDFNSNAQDAVGTVYDVDVRYPELGDAVLSHIQVYYAGTRRRAIHRVLPAPLPAQLDVQLTSDLLPFVHSPLKDTDSVRPTLSWIVDGTTVEEDIVVVGAPVTTVNQLGPNSTWLVFAPPGTRSLRIPEVPPNLRVRFYGDPSDLVVHLREFSDVPDYQTARKNPTRMAFEGAPLMLGYSDRTSEVSFE